jgi:hypothetical protein
MHSYILGNCDSTSISTVYPCIDGYSMTKEDKSSYCPNWRQVSLNCRDSGYIPKAWSYVDSSAIWGIPVSAIYQTYSGGGYFFLLDKEREQSLRQIEDAQNSNWIDRQTRAVITEFTLYNPNTNIFINAVLVLEFLEQGFAVPDVHMRPFTKSMAFNECPSSLQASFAVFVIYIIVLLVDLVHQLITNWRNVMNGVWFWVDVFLVIVCMSSIVMFIIRKSKSDKAEKMFYDQQYTGENGFINYYQIIVLNFIIQVLVGIISFVVILRILRVFEYSKKLSSFWGVIANSSRPLLGFFVIFAVALCAFAFLVYLLFGRSVYDFRNIAIVFGSLANTLIGKNDIVVLLNVSPVFAMLFFFTYGCFVTFILLNIFAAILNETIDYVKKDVQGADDVFGVGDYTMSAVKDFFSLAKDLIKKKRMDYQLHETGKGMYGNDPFAS